MIMVTNRIWIMFKGLLILLLNFTLFGVAFFVAYVAKGDSYGCVILFSLLGGLSYFWTSNIFITIIASAAAIPFTYASFASAMTTNDTRGKNPASFWSFVAGMDAFTIDVLIWSVAGAILGWVVLYVLMRNRRKLVQKVKPYFLLGTICIIVFYIASMIIR